MKRCDWLVYYCARSMEPRKLTEEEANRLFHSTFLLISQQNTALARARLPNRRCGHTLAQPPSTSPAVSTRFSSKLPPETLQQPSSVLPAPSNSPADIATHLKTDPFISNSCSNSEAGEAEAHSNGETGEKVEVSNHGSPCAAAQVSRAKMEQPCQPGTPQQDSEANGAGQTELFTKNMMRELKRELEIGSRGRTCRSAEIDTQTGQVTGFRFLCKNDPLCPFSCLLAFTGRRNHKHEKLYQLVAHCSTHAAGCIESDEEIAYLRLTKRIDHLEPIIAGLLSMAPASKPKEILEGVAEEENEDRDFIYRGLSSKHYLQAAKKYFDNAMYRVKGQLGIPER